jgi:micrococcal nuclease
MKIKVCALLCALLSVHQLGAADKKVEKNYGNVEVRFLEGVCDGDTLNVTIANYPPIIGEKIGVRVFGIDTPELTSRNEAEKALAQKAKEYTQKKLFSARRIILRNMRRDKYFRILAEVEVDGEMLAKNLLDAHFAVPYGGGKKPDWAALLAKIK